MSLIMLWLLLLSECDKEQVVLLIMRTDLNVRNVVDFSCKFDKIISSVISGTLLFYIFYISVTCNLLSMSYNISNTLSFVC